MSWLAPAVVLALMVAYVVPFAWVNMIPDGIRDLQASLAIARGERFQRYGPLINFAFYLGPLSLYLQAVALLFTTSFTAVALWIGLIGSLKFPFAYATGCALQGRSLGLLTALAVALPSIAHYQWVYLFHPTLVEPFVWAAFGLAARCWVRPTLGALYGVALAVGLAVQFHPTAAFYAPLPWLLLLARRRAFGGGPAHAIVLLLPLIAGFLPLLAAGLHADSFRPMAYASTGGDWSLARPVLVMRALRDVPTLFGAMFWDIPALIIADTLWPNGAAANSMANARAILVTLCVVALWGAFRIRNAAPRVRVAGALAFTLLWAGIAIASLMREIVSFYTLYFLLPLAGLAWGIALHAAGALRGLADRPSQQSGRNALSGAHWVIVGLLLALTAAMSWQTVREAREGMLDIYLGGLNDLRHVNQERMRAGRYSAHSRDRAGPWLCAQLAAPRPVILHGEFAFDQASSFGVDLEMFCPARLGEKPLPLLLGRGSSSDANAAGAPPIHWLALSAASWKQLGRQPEFWLGELGMQQPAWILHPALAQTLDIRWHYYEVVHDRQPLQTVRYDLPAGFAPHLLVTRLQPWATAHEISVTCHGNPQPAVVATLMTQVYALPDRQCEIALTTDVPDWVGVAGF